MIEAVTAAAKYEQAVENKKSQALAPSIHVVRKYRQTSLPLDVTEPLLETLWLSWPWTVSIPWRAWRSVPPRLCRSLRRYFQAQKGKGKENLSVRVPETSRNRQKMLLRRTTGVCGHRRSLTYVIPPTSFPGRCWTRRIICTTLVLLSFFNRLGKRKLAKKLTLPKRSIRDSSSVTSPSDFEEESESNLLDFSVISSSDSVHDQQTCICFAEKKGGRTMHLYDRAGGSLRKW